MFPHLIDGTTAMFEPDEADHLAQLEADDQEWAVIKAVGEYFKEAKSLVIIGFVDDGVCEVRFTDPAELKELPENKLDIFVNGEKTTVPLRSMVIEPLVSVPDQKTLTDNPPIPPTGRSMGGDPIWQSEPLDHGTAAFFAQNLIVSPIPYSATNPAVAVPNAVLSCRHVLAGLGAPNDAPIGSPVSMVGRPGGLTLQRKLDLPVDAAAAVVATPADYQFLRIRGLGKLTGVSRARRRLRVYKYGARTGLTTGLCGRPRNINTGGQPLRGFEVLGQFACVHDSGAAVVNNERELVGMVFQGSSANCDINRVTYVLAVAPYRSPNPNDTLYIEFS